MNVYPWLMFVHVAGLLAFVMGHGASAMVSFRLRGERELPRVRALLDLSSASIGLMYVGLLLLLASGIAAGFNGGHWDRFWIWASLGLLIVIIGSMYPMGSLWYGRVRNAAGMRSYRDPGDGPPPEANPGVLDELLSSPRPWLLLGIGGGGILVILWLMLMQPF